METATKITFTTEMAEPEAILDAWLVNVERFERTVQGEQAHLLGDAHFAVGIE